MISKEATARVKINKLLEQAGWRFFPEDGKPANISLELGTKIRENALDEFGIHPIDIHGKLNSILA